MVGGVNLGTVSLSNQKRGLPQRQPPGKGQYCALVTGPDLCPDIPHLWSVWFPSGLRLVIPGALVYVAAASYLITNVIPLVQSPLIVGAIASRIPFVQFDHYRREPFRRFVHIIDECAFMAGVQCLDAILTFEHGQYVRLVVRIKLDGSYRRRLITGVQSTPGGCASVWITSQELNA